MVEDRHVRRLKKQYDLSGSDKCDAGFTVKIPTKTKYLLDQLSKEDKAALIDALKITMASYLHDADFDPIIYFRS